MPVSISRDSAIRDLKTHLQQLANVLPRGQKLIFEGKLLVDEMTLRASKETNGANIMLMASQAAQDGPVRREAPASSGLRRMGELQKSKKVISVEKNQFERWKATGVIALSECNLKAIPAEVRNCGPSARVLDLSRNFLQNLPAAIGSLSSMQMNLLAGKV